MAERFEMECNFLDDTTTTAMKLIRHGDLERMAREERRIKSLDDTELGFEPVVFLGEEDFEA